MELTESYKSLTEAINHGGFANESRVEVSYVDSEEIEKHGVKAAIEKATEGHGAHAILVPGGFGSRGGEGKIAAVQYAREENIPFFGICLGLQMAIIEYARHRAGLEKATSSEFDPGSSCPVIHIMESQRRVERKGGSMRLGAWPCQLKKNSLVRRLYGENEIQERHRHRYEVNNEYRAKLEECGMSFSGTSPDGELVEIIELAGHPWFVGVQFHPEFKSTPRSPHPLFKGFIEAAMAYRDGVKGAPPKKLDSKGSEKKSSQLSLTPGKEREGAAACGE